MTAAVREAFHFDVRVYWEDTDGGGVVYYANYLKFLERGRTEWLRSLGVEQGRLRDEQGLQFAIVDIEVHYRRPALYDDLLSVSVVPLEAGRATVTFEQQIRRGGPDGPLLVEARVRAACLDAHSLKPRPMPRKLIEEIAK
ncbi:MAG TPA: tol-pal system-associated acyl-CoA thioesterase [Steroidobacteraceae bacterium]|nr:tol-pal system-associated acyl-CoA thioesterase [Steroidobacteraceae bacterium]